MATTLDQLRKQVKSWPTKLKDAEESYDMARRDLDRREQRLDEAWAAIERAKELAEDDLPAAELALKDADDLL